jgi:Uma2 family endonuclease
MEASAETTSRRMSLEEWGLLDEDDTAEWVDGRTEEGEVLGSVHELVVAWLNQVFFAWIIPRGGFVFGSGVKFVVTPERGRLPDLTVFFPGRAPPSEGLVRVPPDIAVEVVTPTPRDAQRDRIDKHSEYAAFGIRFYWLVEPQLRTIEIFELGADGRYVSAARAANGRLDRVPGCEHLVLDLDALWAAVDRLKAADSGPGPT